MTNSVVSAPAPEIPGHHVALSEAHQRSIGLARLLHERLAGVFEVNLAETRKQAIQIGDALQRIAAAERDCGGFSGEQHMLADSYKEMLQQHRFAYLAFEHLSNALETQPRYSEVARLAADVQHHLEAAERVHQESLSTF